MGVAGGSWPPGLLPAHPGPPHPSCFTDHPSSHLDASPVGFGMTGRFPLLASSWYLLNKKLTSPCCVRIFTADHRG